MEISNWENQIIKEQYIFYMVFNITYFFYQLRTLLYITSQKKLWKQTIFNINTHFTIRTTYDEFRSSTTIIPQGKET